MHIFLKLNHVLFLIIFMMPLTIYTILKLLGFKLLILIIVPISVLYVSVIIIVSKKFKFKNILDYVFFNSINKIHLVFFILIFVHTMSDALMSTGVGAVIIALSLKLGISTKDKFISKFGITKEYNVCLKKVN